MTDPREGERLAALEVHYKHMKEDVAALKGDVKAILSTLAEAKGGWKTLLMVGGAAGAMGALIGKFLPFLHK